MPIERIEDLTYGVDAVAVSAKFLTDAGLVQVAVDSLAPRFRALEGQTITLHSADDPTLPQGFETGNTLRMITWGVSEPATLDRLLADLGDQAWRDGDAVRTIDPLGLHLAFRLTQRRAHWDVVRQHNQGNNIGRVNEGLLPYGAPRPNRICHLALNVTKARFQAALDWYVEKLRFKAVDDIKDTGTFLQSEGDIDHHNFFLCHRPDTNGVNHFAMEVQDIDAVIEAGNHMITAGWKESRRLGRHLVGSNVFRFFHAPFGGRIEFIADMDRIDKTWETRVHQKNPGHHIWMLKTPANAEPD